MATENVHNYYETLLTSLVNRDQRLQNASQDFIEDVICLTLNQLPAFYVRFDVDATFYMSEGEILEIEAKLKKALEAAIDQVKKNPE